MKLDISEIVRAEGASIPFEFDEQVAGLETEQGFTIQGPVFFSGIVTHVGSRLELRGSLKARYRTECYRCLKELEGTVVVDVEEFFVSPDQAADNEDAYVFQGNELELDKLLKDNVILNLPMKQICSKACKGLCPRCGTNLNEKDCGCPRDEVDSRLEALKNFFQN